MFLGLLVLFTALTISSVAIYYSVAGLVAIFAAASIPIVIMGTTLEIAKLVTAVWLHKYWHQAKWWLKSYLVTAVVVLMFITSMGIFGFLSKAHIEQTANANEGLAQLERIESELTVKSDVIQRARQEIAVIQSTGAEQDTAIQEQIDREQERIDTAYARIQPAIDEQLASISREESAVQQRVAIFETQLQEINSTLVELTNALNANDVKRAQGLVGVRQDGSLGPATSAAIQDFRTNEEAKRTDLLNKIEEIRTAPNTAVENARNEINRLRNLAETQIEQSNALINRLRTQLGVVDVEAIKQKIAEQESVIMDASAAINTLTEQKYTLQAEYRALEAEVGPIKYIAEFVYGETDKMLLEEAVRWVIIIIIFVFDPLAVLLLIASQQTFEMRKKELDLQKEELDNDQIFDRPNDEQSDRESSTTTNNNNSEDEIHTVINNDTIEELLEPIGAGDNGGDSTIDLAEQQRRIEILEHKEQDEEYKNQKQAWKAEHPDQTVKFWKDQYIKGKVDKLPWENDFLSNE